MSFEIPPLLADWLKDATYGINALLPTIPRDGGDTQPPNVTVCDEIRDAWLARKQITTEKLTSIGTPVVGVFQSGEATYPIGKPQRPRAGGLALDGEGSWMMLYIARQSDSAKAASWCRYTLRAVLNSLVLLSDPVNGAARVRNATQIIGPAKFQMSTLLEERGDALVTGGVLAVYTVRELAQIIVP